jgi:hypothetical protein
MVMLLDVVMRFPTFAMPFEIEPLLLLRLARSCERNAMVMYIR